MKWCNYLVSQKILYNASFSTGPDTPLSIKAAGVSEAVKKSLFEI